MFKEHSIVVQTTSLDAYCEKRKIGYIDFLKIDTEGAEPLVLRGAQQLLEAQAIGAIQFEYGERYRNTATSLETVYRTLEQNGYKIFRIIPGGLLACPTWDPAMEVYRYSNYLALLPSIEKQYTQPAD